MAPILREREAEPNAEAEHKAQQKEEEEVITDLQQPSPEEEMNGEEEYDEDQWFRDRNTPFKMYVRAYAKLKGVQGRLGQVDEESGILKPAFADGPLDVLAWKL